MAWEPWNDPYTKFAYDPTYQSVFKPLNQLADVLSEQEKRELDELRLEQEKLKIEEAQKQIQARTALTEALAANPEMDPYELAAQQSLQSGDMQSFQAIDTFRTNRDAREEARKEKQQQREMETALTRQLSGLPPEQRLSAAADFFSTTGNFKEALPLLRFQEEGRRERERANQPDKQRDPKLEYFMDASGKQVILDLTQPGAVGRIYSEGLRKYEKPEKEKEDKERVPKLAYLMKPDTGEQVVLDLTEPGAMQRIEREGLVKYKEIDPLEEDLMKARREAEEERGRGSSGGDGSKLDFFTKAYFGLPASTFDPKTSPLTKLLGLGQAPTDSPTVPTPVAIPSPAPTGAPRKVVTVKPREFKGVEQ